MLFAARSGDVESARLLLEAGYGNDLYKEGGYPRPDALANPSIIRVVELAGAIPGLA